MSKRYCPVDMNEPCPIRAILDRIGDRWSMLIFWSLANGSLRFTELKRKIDDISQRMLAKTLRRLEQDGFVLRTVTPTVPPRVDYELTELGRSFLSPLGALVDWAEENHKAINAARSAYVAPQTSWVA